MPAQEDIADQQALLASHRRTLATLIQQQALFGVAYSPPALVAGIQDACENIRRVKAILRAWGGAVEDHPDDDADRRSPAHPAPPEQEGIALLRPRGAVAHDLQDLIMRGASQLDRVRTSPPTSQAALDAESSVWHRWRQSSQQALRDSFSSPKPLQWLDALILPHLDFAQTWETRANVLLADYEQDLSFLSDLVARLENYQERLK